MNLSFTIEFSSSGLFTPGLGNVHYWVDSGHWENQYASGRYFELNLIWFNVSVEYTCRKVNGENQ